ncbi:MAG: VTT domain-containing protein [Aeromicrobium sp.]|uniref:VTT domain-containing protein n=1 Tax=Aeromicrobium sp. TaxID=1871063 RepID=UPI00261AEB15|nr:VTT domain-containing protein [Aeromicrobium sp.]MDF1704578.1 VTT domain-containing protein [Aeromicrobium sp.]
MNDVLESIRSWPWAWAWLALFAIVVLRAGGTFVIGRLIAGGAGRGREPSPRMQIAIERVDRWGPPAVTLSFLTVGAQTVINLAAGLCRMTTPRYLLGLVPGAVLWATIWTSIGAGVVAAVSAGGAGSVLLVVVALLVFGAVLGVASRTSSSRNLG